MQQYPQAQYPQHNAAQSHNQYHQAQQQEQQQYNAQYNQGQPGGNAAPVSQRPLPPNGFKPFVPEPPLEYMCDVGGIFSLLFGSTKPAPTPAPFIPPSNGPFPNNFGAYGQQPIPTPPPLTAQQLQLNAIQQQQLQQQQLHQFQQQRQQKLQQQQQSSAPKAGDFQRLMEDAKKRNEQLKKKDAFEDLQVEPSSGPVPIPAFSPTPMPEVVAPLPVPEHTTGLFGAITNFVGLSVAEPVPVPAPALIPVHVPVSEPLPTHSHAPVPTLDTSMLPSRDNYNNSSSQSVGKLPSPKYGDSAAPSPRFADGAAPSPRDGPGTPRVLTMQSKSSSYFSMHDSLERHGSSESVSQGHGATGGAVDEKADKLERLLSVHGVPCRLLMPPPPGKDSKDAAKGKKSALRLSTDGKEFVLEILSSKPGVQGKKLNFKTSDVTAVNKGRSAMLTGLPGFDDSKIFHFSLTGKPELNLEVDDANIRDALAVGLWGVAARKRASVSRAVKA